MRCNLCGGSSDRAFTGRVLHRHDVSYFHCSRCGFLQTEAPYWLSEAYAEPIARLDTGILERNDYLVRKAAPLLFHLFDRQAKYLDYAGGYGIFARRMRDVGFDYYWEDKYSPNLFCRGFEYAPGTPVELVSSFESFEHFPDPGEELEKILALSPNLLFSVQLLPSPLPALDRWWYYGPEHGQHISFYTLESLRTLSRRHGLTLHSDNSHLHLMTRKEIPPRRFQRVLQNKGSRNRLAHVQRRMISRTQADYETLRTRGALP